MTNTEKLNRLIADIQSCRLVPRTIVREGQFGDCTVEFSVNPVCGVTLQLDAYEAANLKAALNCAWHKTRNPLYVLNTGDWLGQIIHKLPNVDHRPNKTTEELIAEAINFK